MRVSNNKWRRRIGRTLTLSLALALVVAVAPARVRDRGGARGGMRTGGAQRWELHLDDCELPFHGTAADTSARSVLISVPLTTSLDPEAAAGDVHDERVAVYASEDGRSLFPEPRGFAGAFLASAPSRAPPM